MLKFYIVFVLIFFTSVLQAADFRFTGKKRGAFSGSRVKEQPLRKKPKSSLDQKIIKARQTQSIIDAKMSALETKVNLAIKNITKTKFIISQHEAALEHASDPNEKCLSLKIIAEILMASLHYDRAIEQFSHMLAISKESKLDSFFTVEALLGLMEAHINSSNYNIFPLIEEAKDLIKGDMHLIRYYTATANYYAAYNEYDMADLYFDLAVEYLYKDNIMDLDYYVSKGIYIVTTKGVHDLSMTRINNKIENILSNAKFTYRKIPQFLKLIKFYELSGNYENLKLYKNKLKTTWNKNNFFPIQDIPLPDEYKEHQSGASVPAKKTENRKIEKEKGQEKSIELLERQNSINGEIKRLRKGINNRIGGFSGRIEDRIRYLQQLFINASAIEKCCILKMLAEMNFSKMDYAQAARNYFKLYEFSKNESVEKFWIVEGLLGYLEVSLEILNKEIAWGNYFEEVEKLLEGKTQYLKFYTLRARYFARSNSINLAYEDFKYGEKFTQEGFYSEVFDYYIAQSIFLISNKFNREMLGESLRMVDILMSKKTVQYNNIPTILQLIQLLELRHEYNAALGYINNILRISKCVSFSRDKLEQIISRRSRLQGMILKREKNEINRGLSNIDTQGYIPDWDITNEANLKVVYPHAYKYDGIVRYK